MEDKCLTNGEEQVRVGACAHLLKRVKDKVNSSLENKIEKAVCATSLK